MTHVVQNKITKQHLQAEKRKEKKRQDAAKLVRSSQATARQRSNQLEVIQNPPTLNSTQRKMQDDMGLVLTNIKTMELDDWRSKHDYSEVVSYII